jgi:hypothetical protein
MLTGDSTVAVAKEQLFGTYFPFNEQTRINEWDVFCAVRAGAI